MSEQRDLQKEGQDIQLELKEMDHKVNKFQRDSKDAATKVMFSSASILGDSVAFKLAVKRKKSSI